MLVVISTLLMLINKNNFPIGIEGRRYVQTVTSICILMSERR